MRLKIHLQYLPRLFCAALSALLTLLAVAALWWQFAERAEQHWQAVLGQSISAMAAKSAVDATLNHDLVSLQVVLQDAVHSERITFATIHDVENNLLVQAGVAPSRHQLAELYSVAAPISFQQSVAGYLTVYLQPRTLSPLMTWAFYGAIGLLFIIALLSLMDVWRLVFERLEEPESDAPRAQDSGDYGIEDEALVKNLNSEREEGAGGSPLAITNGSDQIVDEPLVDSGLEQVNAAPVAPEYVKVMIQIEDFERLQAMLSADLLMQLQAQWVEYADAARIVYGGHWERAPSLTLQEGVLITTFSSSNSLVEALRSASFFSHVVKALLQQGKVTAKVRSIIAELSEFDALESFPNAPAAMLLSEESAAQLQPRLSLEPLAQGWWQLIGFDEAYEGLLAGQVVQFQQV